MYGGICICVLLAALSVSSLGQQPAGSHDGSPLVAELQQSLTEPRRHSRSPSSAGPLKPAPRLDGSLEQRATIGALLAKYLQQARKGTAQLLPLWHGVSFRDARILTLPSSSTNSRIPIGDKK